jgi:cystathionine beta-lyase/cystathionine gamma-synthase
VADREKERRWGFSTRAIHAGQEPDPVTGAVMPPIYQTSTYVQSAVGEHKGYEYARTHNKTRAALEACVASLEGVDHGIAFASGTAAIHAILTLLQAGDEVVAGENLRRHAPAVRAGAAALRTFLPLRRRATRPRSRRR